MSGRGAGETFVGRDNELGQLLAGMEEAQLGRGRLFLVGGEAGIGKSRLADEFASLARERGTRVLTGRCWEAGGAPAYWPWVMILRAAIRASDPDSARRHLGTGAAEIAQIVPEVAELMPELPVTVTDDPEAARFRLFDSTTTFLVNLASETPLVVVLDDLQVADAPSQLLLQFVAGQLAQSRLLILATYRSVDIGRDNPVRAALADLSREPATRTIALRGLSAEDVGAFIDAQAGFRPDPSLVAAIHRETEGNPLFVDEIVRLLAQEGRLEQAPGAAPFKLTVPEGVRDVIGRRLDHLSEGCNRLLTVASVLGREFGLDALERVSEQPAQSVLETLDEAVTARVVSEVPGGIGRFAFGHALIRDTLYDELSTVRRVKLHRLVADQLEGLYAGRLEPHLAELAYHYFEAAPGGDVDKAVRYGRLAGEHAAAQLAYEEAARLYRMSVQALDATEAEDERTRCELLLLLGDAEARSADTAGAKATFLRAADIAERHGMPELLAGAAIGYGGRFVWQRAGGDRHLIPLLERALSALPEGDSPDRVRVLARLSCALRNDPDRARASALSAEAVDIARRLGDATVLAYALDGRFGSIWWPENPVERQAIAEELQRVGAGTPDSELKLQSHFWPMTVLLELGEMERADEWIVSMLELADSLHQASHAWLRMAVGGMMALFRGDLEEAERQIEHPRQDRFDNTDYQSAFALQRYRLWKERGRSREAIALEEAAAERFPWYPVHRCALLDLWCEVGEEDTARAGFHRLAADEFRLLPIDNEWLMAMSILSDVADHLQERAGAEILYRLLLPYEGRSAVASAEGIAGAVDRSLGQLAATLGRYHDAERHFRAGLDLNERLGGRPWAAYTRFGLARVLLARGGEGEREEAMALLLVTSADCEEMGMVSLGAKAAGLLAELGAGARPPSADPSPEAASGAVAPPSVFQREGEYWHVAFDGSDSRIRETKGMHHIARLLAAPGREVHVLDLVAVAEGAAPPTPAGSGGELDGSGLGDAGELLDAEAKAAYRLRVTELEEEIDEARSWNDPEREARAREELDFLARELAGAVGLGGRDRVAASASERARVNVTRAIRSAVTRIREHSPALGRHLDVTLRTGTFCSYVPDPRAPIDWRL